ncbi:MAG: hypothetical protein IKU84_02125 [Clostridia bacterium]|nr:hypothetical protein [Clostridia bacterium]
MKKIICTVLSLAFLFSLVACGGEIAEEVKPENENKEPVYYEGHGIKMEIPAVWQDTFTPYYKEFGEGATAFELREFMTVINGDEAGVLTVASFNNESWKTALAATPEGEKMKIGTSKDGNKHFTIRFEETKFKNEEDQKKFDQIVAAAKKCCENIEITE